MKRKLTFDSILILLLAMVMAACDGDDAGLGPAVATGRCSIISRASGETGVETLPNELINNWWVVFVDGSGTVRKIAANSPELAAPVERDEFSVELPASTYTLYAFANLSPEQLYAATGLRFEPGEKVGQGVGDAVWSVMANNPGESVPVPMSGTATVNFRNANTEFTVELVRMLAKIRLSVKNSSAEPLEINSLSFGLLNKGPVTLLPDYASLGSCPAILDEARDSKEELSFAIGRTVDAGQSVNETFYVRESSAALTHPAGRYFVTFGITRQGGASVEEHYAVADELQWIQRNDFIDIPIVISDMTVDWSVLFYPPIGGYPAVATEAEGDSHFLTFGTPGKFRLRPEIRSNGNLVAPAGYDFGITDIEGDREIFAALPAKDPVTGEIVGELSSRTGMAVLTCVVAVNTGGRQSERVRKIYIIRK